MELGIVNGRPDGNTDSSNEDSFVGEALRREEGSVTGKELSDRLGKGLGWLVGDDRGCTNGSKLVSVPRAVEGTRDRSGLGRFDGNSDSFADGDAPGTTLLDATEGFSEGNMARWLVGSKLGIEDEEAETGALGLVDGRCIGVDDGFLLVEGNSIFESNGIWIEGAFVEEYLAWVGFGVGTKLPASIRRLSNSTSASVFSGLRTSPGTSNSTASSVGR